MLSIVRNENLCKIVINDEMTIYTVAELKDHILSVLDENVELDIDLKNVNKIDSAGVQLLMLIRKNRRLCNQTVSLSGHSDAVVDVFQLMGLISYFNDPILIRGDKGRSHES